MFRHFSIQVIKTLYIESNTIYYFILYISNLLVKLFFLKGTINPIAIRKVGFNIPPGFDALPLVPYLVFFLRATKVVGKT